MKRERTQRFVGSAIFLALGAVICLLSLGVIPISPGRITVPLWILFFVGLLIVFTGGALLAPSNSALSVFFVATAESFLAFVFSWAVFFGKPWICQSGVPLLPPSVDYVIGRTLLYSFTFVLWLLSFLIWRSFVTRARSAGKQTKDSGMPGV